MEKLLNGRYGRDIRVKRTEVILVIGLGLAVGLFLGYILMGTAHAMFDIGAEEHYQQQ